ncbi:MAG TPA: PQQ-dependent sugar dehydrogenase [bacterium]|nr:PQQ-dependent sugar dehydrogenase [bacterium]
MRGYLLFLQAMLATAAACRDAVPLGNRTEPGVPPRDAVPIAGQQLYVPSGFSVRVFAQGLYGVRNLALRPGGTVYAALSAAGTIVQLVDTSCRGVGDSVVTILSGLDYPFGMAFRGDTLYFAEQTTVKRLDPAMTTPVTLVSNLPSGGHVTRTLVFGPDNLMYVAIGSSCNVCDEADPRRAAVVRYNLDGSGEHVFATGLRNSVGLAFHPTTGALWANNNDRDNIGPTQDVTDTLPPEHLNILSDGKWYGWPQCYLPGAPNPEYVGADCSTVTPPALTFQAHSAPLGLVFYGGAMFPPDYGGDAFMTYHGSWNRTVPTGAKVVRVHVQNGLPLSIEDFVTGWQLADGSRWGRPVGIVVASDGALLVADDLGGVIWRVSYSPVPAMSRGATQRIGVTPRGFTRTSGPSRTQTGTMVNGQR